MDIDILCKGKWIGPLATTPTEVEVLCKARWIIVGLSATTGVRP
jgi:hypothetical protein